MIYLPRVLLTPKQTEGLLSYFPSCERWYSIGPEGQINPYVLFGIWGCETEAEAKERATRYFLNKETKVITNE